MSYRTIHTPKLGLKISTGNTGIGDVYNISKDNSTCGQMSKYCKPFCYLNSPFYNSMPNIAKAHSHNTKIFRDCLAHPIGFGGLQTELIEFLNKRNIHSKFPLSLI